MPQANTEYTPLAPPLTSGKTALTQIPARGTSDASLQDEGLLALCEEAHQRRAAYDAMDYEIERGTPAEEAHAAYMAAVRAVAISPARTIPGLAGKALVLKQEHTRTDEVSVDLMLSLVNDCVTFESDPSHRECRPRAVLDIENPDAELIAICAQFEEYGRQIQAFYEPDEIDEDQAMESLHTIQSAQMAPLLNRMEEVRAQTPAGIHARARALAASNRNFEHSFEAKGTAPQRLLACLMRDAVALGVQS